MVVGDGGQARRRDSHRHHGWLRLDVVRRKVVVVFRDHGRIKPLSFGHEEVVLGPLALDTSHAPEFGSHGLGRKLLVVTTIEDVLDVLLKVNLHLGLGLGFGQTVSPHLKNDNKVCVTIFSYMFFLLSSSYLELARRERDETGPPEVVVWRHQAADVPVDPLALAVITCFGEKPEKRVQAHFGQLAVAYSVLFGQLCNSTHATPTSRGAGRRGRSGR